MSPFDLALLVLLSAIWGASYLFIRIAVPAFGPVPLAELRVILAAGALAFSILVVRRERLALSRWREYLVLGALNNAIPFVTIAAAELVVTASLGAIVNATSPLFTVIVSSIAMRRVPSGWQLLGTVVGFGGVAVLVGVGPLDRTPAVFVAIALLLAGALGYALAAVYASRTFHGVRPVDVAVGQLGGCAVVLLVPALLTRPAAAPDPLAVASLVALSLIGTAFAYQIYFRLIGRAGPTRAITVTLLIPIFGVLFGHLFLGDPVGPGLLVGVALVLAGVCLVTGLFPRGRAAAGEH